MIQSRRVRFAGSSDNPDGRFSEARRSVSTRASCRASEERRSWHPPRADLGRRAEPQTSLFSVPSALRCGQAVSTLRGGSGQAGGNVRRVVRSFSVSWGFSRGYLLVVVFSCRSPIDWGRKVAPSETALIIRCRLVLGQGRRERVRLLVRHGAARGRKSQVRGGKSKARESGGMDMAPLRRRRLPKKPSQPSEVCPGRVLASPGSSGCVPFMVGMEDKSWRNLRSWDR